MKNRLLNLLGVGIIYFSASMLFAQIFLGAYLAFAWKIDRSKINQMIAAAQGYDFYRMEDEKRRDLIDKIQREKYDEVLQLRAERLLQGDMDRARGGVLEDSILVQIRRSEDRKKQFEEVVRNFEKRIADLENERRSTGFTELVANISLLSPANAKIQIMKMIDDKRENQVVNILNAMEEGPRKKLLNVMKEEEEVEKLADILRRIADGEPDAKIIQDTRDELSR